MSDNLETTLYENIIKAAGGTVDDLPDRLKSTYLKRIAECVAAGGGASGGGVKIYRHAISDGSQTLYVITTRAEPFTSIVELYNNLPNDYSNFVHDGFISMYDDMTSGGYIECYGGMPSEPTEIKYYNITLSDTNLTDTVTEFCSVGGGSTGSSSGSGTKLYRHTLTYPQYGYESIYFFSLDADKYDSIASLMNANNFGRIVRVAASIVLVDGAAITIASNDSTYFKIVFYSTDSDKVSLSSMSFDIPADENYNVEEL